MASVPVSQCRIQGWGRGEEAHCLHVEWLLLLLLVCRTVSPARSAQRAARSTAARQQSQHTKTRMYVRRLFSCWSLRGLGQTGLGWTTTTVETTSELQMGESPRRPSPQQRKEIWTFCLNFPVADTQQLQHQ